MSNENKSEARCKTCGAPFVKTAAKQKYCSKACRPSTANPQFESSTKLQPSFCKHPLSRRLDYGVCEGDVWATQVCELCGKGFNFQLADE